MKIGRILFVSALLVVIVFRYIYFPKDDQFLKNYLNNEVVLEGIVSNEPDVKPNHINVRLRVTNIYPLSSNQNESPLNYNPKNAMIDKEGSIVLVSLPQFSSVDYGDALKTTGKIEHPKIIVSDDGTDFDYPTYLAKDKIFYVQKSTELVVLSKHNGYLAIEYLLRLKLQLLKNISNALPTPYSFLAGGLIIAGKGSLSNELQEEFKKAGIIHVVVLSGSNITIVGQFIIAVFSFLPAPIKNSLGAAGVIGFSIMAGSSATVVRSVIMSFIALFANSTGYKYNAGPALLIAGLFMLVQNPKILFYDASFQLSFAATAALILLSSHVEKFLKWIPKASGLREIVSSTVATQIFVTPLILHLTGMFSFVALFVNMLVLPLIPPTMLVVFITSVASFIHQSLATPFAVVSYFLLAYELYVVHLFSSLPFAAITFKKISWFVTLSIYGLFGLVYCGAKMYVSKTKDNHLIDQHILQTKNPPE